MSYGKYLTKVREKRPLVHHLTNYVTVNDCANVTLCAGGSPVMSDEALDIVDISKIASAVVINMGTLNERTVKSMVIAGKIANDHCIPVIFDPVGVGASTYRNEVAQQILDNVEVTVIKGNAGEIGVLSGLGGKVRGVDSVSSGDSADAAIELAKIYNTSVVMTGKDDYISNGKKTMKLSNGDPLMDCVSGTGCMLSSVVGCYVGAIDASIYSIAASVGAFTIAGEIAAKTSAGPGSFKVNLLDALYNLTPSDMDTRMKIE